VLKCFISAKTLTTKISKHYHKKVTIFWIKTQFIFQNTYEFVLFNDLNIITVNQKSTLNNLKYMDEFTYSFTFQEMFIVVVVAFR